MVIFLVKVLMIYRVQSKYRKIVSGDTYYSDVETADSMLYDPATILEEEQWYKLEKFSKIINTTIGVASLIVAV
ncbi:hypothetical protein [Anaerobutyricum hallii]|uniref:hypothetical protein n=1 Tax=Anaerobutyricum hallii TaxID=39488 RepID=UPI002673DE0A|nr:hypothetical protein [Anaerobutyricum hallii]